MGKEKFTLEIKFAVVIEVLKGRTYADVSEEFRVPQTVIERWKALYENHGIDGLKSRNRIAPQETYDGEFHIRVIEYMHEHGLSYSKTAAYFMVDTATISRWDKKYLNQGAAGLMFNKNTKPSGNTPKEKRPKAKVSVEELMKENERLRMENDYLKKLNALIHAPKKK